MDKQDLEGIENVPYISVIITAHDRRQYIIDAIKSALNQTLNRSLYEIIVVKNFWDEEIDKFIEENNIKNIYTNEIEMGKELAIAIETAKGGIISFLDDDDKYFKNKLEVVYNYFKKDNEILYYHNELGFIDDQDKIINYKLPKIKERFLLKLPANLKTIGRLLSLYQDSNMSSISVRKDVLTKNMSFLENLSISPDTYVFYQSLSFNKGKMFFDPSVLTYYRKHNSLSTISTDIFNDYLKKEIEISKRRLESSYIIFNSLSNSTSKAVVKSIKCRLIAMKTNYFIWNDDANLKFIDQLRLIKCSFIQNRRDYIFLNLGALAVRVNKKWARRNFFERNKKISSVGNND